jgi:serine protease Do
MARASIRSRRLSNPLAFIAYFGTCGLGAAAILGSSAGCACEGAAQAQEVASQDAVVEVARDIDDEAPQGGLDYDPRKSLAPLVEAVSPAVVSIHAKGKPVGPRLPFIGPQGETDGTGSGFVFDSEGVVVTNHHVVDGARKLEVRLPDGRAFEARVLGSDAATDLAVLRLEGASELPTVELGDSSALRVGDWVVAIGSPMGLEHSATVGILSGRSRGNLGLYADSYLDFLQTDADIAPGSSGGPLFDLKGRVVGITTAVGAGGPGFAIPIDQAKTIIPQLRDDGKVVRGWLGAASVPEDRSRGGARIGKVFANTPAADAGLREGDLVTALDGSTVDSFDELRGRIAELRPGHTVTMTVKRDERPFEVPVVLAERPASHALSRLREAPRSSTPLRSIPATKPDSKGRLGVRARSTERGLEVVEVEPRSLAAELDLRPGDIIERINTTEIAEPSDVGRALSARTDRIEAALLRDGVPHRVTLRRS